MPWDIDKEGDYSLQVIPGMNVSMELTEDTWTL